MTSRGTHCKEACEVLLLLLYVKTGQKSTAIKDLLKIFFRKLLNFIGISQLVCLRQYLRPAKQATIQTHSQLATVKSARYRVLSFGLGARKFSSMEKDGITVLFKYLTYYFFTLFMFRLTPA